MKTYNYIFQNNQFTESIDYSLFKDEKDVLIQVFCGQDKYELAYIITILTKNIPQAICIGTTTDGEIKCEEISTLRSVISISVFEHTTLKASFKKDNNSFKNGYEIAQDIITPNTKLIITFADGTSTNGEEYLKGITTYSEETMVCGGMAGDNGCFNQTYISLGEQILKSGAVAVSLNSDILQVRNDRKYDWYPIGISHTIDKIDGNRIYEISGMKAVEFYEKYLGDINVHAEFPLIVERNGISVARAVLKKYDDGSVSCAGNLYEGDKVKLGFANAELIIQNPVEYIKKIHEYPAETFFIYSCMARRRYMQSLIKVEIEPFAVTAPTAGFFTYAEFFHTGKTNELMNQTITLVGLTENPISKKEAYKGNKIVPHEEGSYAKTVQALTSLIKQSTADQNEQAKKLEEQIKYSKTLIKNQKLFLRHTVHETNTPLSVIMSNIDLYNMEHGENRYLENIEVAVKNLYSIYDELSYLIRRDQVKENIYPVDIVDVVRSRIDFFKNVASQINSEFQFYSNCDSHILVMNETKLTRIIDNSLTNAIKYTFMGKPIRIDIVKKTGFLKLLVSSQSKQIEQPEKIFEAYYREERSKDGFGIGLNLVKKICDEEGIEIKVMTHEKITCFTYIFKDKI